MSEPGHYIKPPFTDEQLAHLEKMFTAVGQELEQVAHSSYTTNEAAQEALRRAGSVLQMFQPQFIEP